MRKPMAEDYPIQFRLLTAAGLLSWRYWVHCITIQYAYTPHIYIARLRGTLWVITEPQPRIRNQIMRLIVVIIRTAINPSQGGSSQ